MKNVLYTTCLLLLTHCAFGQYSISSIGTPVTENFTAFAGAGFRPNPSAGQLDSDNWAITGFSDGSLAFGGTQTAGDYSRGTTAGGGETSGGIFGNTSGDMIWIQPVGSDFTPGTMTARYQNNTGTIITSIDVSYTIHCLNNEARANSFNFSWSTDDVTYTPEASLDYTSTAGANGSTTNVTRTITITGLSLANGAMFYIRWMGSDVSGSGSRDEFGLDDISVTGNGAVVCTGPPTTVAPTVTVPTVGATSLGISWTNGDGANRIVVMREANAVTATPTNNTTYSANSGFGLGTDLGGNQYVVYDGSGSSITVTGLTPNTTYHVAVYEYNCLPGSEEYLTTLSTNIASETTTNTPVPTTLTLGDIVIIGVNANNNACSGVTAEDFISFVAFKDITIGTSIDITDNGWERGNAGQFGNSEGTYNLVYNGAATIPAGTVFTLIFPNSAIGVVNAANPDWTITSLAGTGILNMNNGGDQIFIMQGGTWANGSGVATHDATYTGGTFLFGFNTRTTWAANGTTQQSNLHPAVICANILPTGGTTDYIYYNGPVTATNAGAWFDRVSDNTNWTSEANCSDYNSNFTITTIPINNATNYIARWTGAVSTDWFDCQNWDVRRVPTSTIDVIVDASTSVNNCEIDQTSIYAPNYGNIASCNNITINDEVVRLMGTSDQLHIHGNLLIESGTSTLDMNQGGTDGQVFLHGNWTNQDDNNAFDRGTGTVNFVGTNNQTIATSDPAGLEIFYNVVVNKGTGDLINTCTQMNIDNNMNFQSGIVQATAAQELRFDVDATASNASNSSHVNGPVSKETSNSAATTFTFPIGKSGILGQLGIATTTFDGERFQAEYFYATHGDSYNVNAAEMDHVSQVEYWELDDVLNLGTSSNVTLHWGPHSFVGSMANLRVAHYYTEAPNPSNRWESEGNTGTTGTITSGTVTSNVISTYSPFTLADVIGDATLPLKLLAFDATVVGKESQITWEIVQEEANTTYTIERSVDGVNFEILGTVQGTAQPNETAFYNWLDVLPMLGVNYYRLHINEGGVVRYSSIKAVTFEGNFVNMMVYPSPASEQLTIELGDLPQSAIVLEVYNTLGQRLLSQRSGKTQKHVLNTADLSAGSYILQVSEVGNSSSKKQVLFVKK